MNTFHNGKISYWMEESDRPAFAALATGASADDSNQAPASDSSSAPLPKDTQDLLIVGGGLTGLWTAYFASLEHPDWTITVLEAKQVGYGASGRNGGWLSTLLPGNRAVYAQTVDAAGGDGLAAVRTFQQEMFTTIHDTLDVLRTEGIEAHQTQGGNLRIAQTPAGMQRILATYENDLEYGYSSDDVRILDASAVRARVNVDGVLGGAHYQHTNAVDPALLTRGLAKVVVTRGVRICEGTPVTHISQGRVTTTRGPVRGTTILCCLEAYSGTVTGDAPGLGGRHLIPVNSSMIVTEPLDEETWARIGWDNRDCLNDAAHTFIYAQQTADGRIAIGGRGAPYAFNSGTPGDGEVSERTIAQLKHKLSALFPGVELPIAHSWRGIIGVTRDWCAGIYFDPATRLGAARGYAGHGVTATHLAARTLLDRAAGRTTVRTELPWNDHDSGLWEPEPIRWLGVHSMYRLFEFADSWEQRRGAEQTSLVARLGSRLAGLHE